MTNFFSQARRPYSIISSHAFFVISSLWCCFLLYNLTISLQLPERLVAITTLLSIALFLSSIGVLFLGSGRSSTVIEWPRFIPHWKFVFFGLMVLTLFFAPLQHIIFEGGSSQQNRKLQGQRKTLLSIANAPGACYAPAKRCDLPDLPEYVSPLALRDYYSGDYLLSAMHGNECRIYSVGRDGVSQNGVEASVPDNEIGIDGLKAMVPSRFWKGLCKRFLPDACRVAPGDLTVPLPPCLKE